jgi:hypothetical protein
MVILQSFKLRFLSVMIDYIEKFAALSIALLSILDISIDHYVKTN